MKGKNNRNIILFIIFIILITASCSERYEGDIRIGQRDLRIDVENKIFEPQDAENNWDKGLGVSSVKFSIILDDGSKEEVVTEKVFTSDDIDTEYSYTPFPVTVTGQLIRIEAEAAGSGGAVYNAVIEDKNENEFYGGWTIFANVMKFRLGCQINTDDFTSGFMELNVAPRGGNAALLKIDSGEQELYMAVTDRRNLLTPLQIAIEPELNECPLDMNFDVYTSIINKDLRAGYDDNMNFDAFYNDYPWSEVWTYDEVTQSGRRINDSIYTLQKYNNGEPLTFLDPMGDGYKSYLIDLTELEDDPTGKFLLITIVLNYDRLSTPAAMECIEIK